MDCESWFLGELQKLQERLGYRFEDLSRLKTALVHSSYANEKGAGGHNERMEFLGDAALELGVSHYLYEKHPDFDEGALSRARAGLVCGKSLAEWAVDLGLWKLLRTGNGLDHDGGGRSSLCSDAAEALFGAVFLDGGLPPLMKLIESYLAFHAARNPLKGREMDPKSSLQIAAHEKGLPSPSYEVLSVTGPSHSPRFTVKVMVGAEEGGMGEGESKKEAEFAAAEKTLSMVFPDGACLK